MARTQNRRVDTTKKALPNPGVLRAVEIAGSQRKLARLMGVEQPTIHNWLYISCPPERALELEETVGVSRLETCPEIFR